MDGWIMEGICECARAMHCTVLECQCSTQTDRHSEYVPTITSTDQTVFFHFCLSSSSSCFTFFHPSIHPSVHPPVQCATEGREFQVDSSEVVIIIIIIHRLLRFILHRIVLLNEVDVVMSCEPR